MDVTVWLDLGAVDRAADGPAAIDLAETAGQVDTGERWPQLAWRRLERELHEGNLDPVIGRDGRHARYEDQGQSGEDRDAPRGTERHEAALRLRTRWHRLGVFAGAEAVRQRHRPAVGGPGGGGPHRGPAAPRARGAPGGRRPGRAGSRV